MNVCIIDEYRLLTVLMFDPGLYILKIYCLEAYKLKVKLSLVGLISITHVTFDYAYTLCTIVIYVVSTMSWTEDKNFTMEYTYTIEKVIIQGCLCRHSF